MEILDPSTELFFGSFIREISPLEIGLVSLREEVLSFPGRQGAVEMG